jgi:trimeric autotransporter adhesin
MKTKFTYFFIMLALLACINQVAAQGTAFTYQGRLNISASPANGSYDLKFSLFSGDSGGSALAGPMIATATSVSNGLFTVTLDFGGQFPGADRWLEIAVRTNGIGTFITLTPRQQITPAPYAIVANTASSLVNGRPILQNTNGAPNIIAGSPGNFVSAGVIGATISGGGNTNYARTVNETNSVTANFGTVSGGERNTASGQDGTVAGGFSNTASGGESTVSGGAGNVASGVYDTVVGGQQNTASGGDATAVGGYGNVASGSLSFAAGYEAQATHYSSFVWSDYSGTGFSSTAANQFSVRASGGIVLAGDVQMEGGAANYHHLALSGGNSEGFLFGSYPYFGDGVHLGYNFYADANGSPHVIHPDGGTSRISADYAEVVLAVGPAGFGPNQVKLDATLTGVTVYGTFNNSSDRNAKQNFVPVSPSQILDKVLQLPVSEWSYKTDASTRHIGPMGQDFYSTFNLGTDEKHIAPIDEGGVAFAAIQGLNQKLQEELNRQDAKNAELKRQNDLLAERLNELDAAMKQLAARR